MKAKAIGAAVAALTLAASAQAQDSALDAGQVEFFAEALVMGDVCDDVGGFHVVRDDLHYWVSARLASHSVEDLDSVLALRDSKIEELLSNASNVREMSRGSSRQRAVDAHYAGLITRCSRMSDDSRSSEYFLRSSASSGWANSGQ